jgi:hypothetical protein
VGKGEPGEAEEGCCLSNIYQDITHIKGPEPPHVSSVGHAADALLEAFTMYAYGIYGEDTEAEPVAIVDGVHVATGMASPQHQLNTDTIRITCPQFEAEKRAMEAELWKVLRRRAQRLRELKDGRCLKCHCENDQPRRRFCSECEKRLAERRELLDTSKEL